jgi:AraC-like DNA-binding protein
MNDHYRATDFDGQPLGTAVPGGLDGGAVRHAFVHSVSLSAFDQLVRSLGGDPQAFVDPAAIIYPAHDNDGGIISYRDFIHVLHVSARQLDCPSFGLQLAKLQSADPVLPVSMGIAMRHSETIGAAYRYCAEHLQSFSPVLQTRIEKMPESSMMMHRFDILLDRVPHQQQAVEHAIALLHHSIHALSGGTVRSRGIWFKHEPIAPSATYRQYFQADVRFGMPMTGVLLTKADLATPLPNRNPHLYEIATRFIESQYPAPRQMLSHQVRSIILRTLGMGDCTHEATARALCLHPRTLQRRLRDEGTGFEKIRDEVRKELALQYFAQPTVPLIRIAGLLGYSEQSVLTRSCYRWFATSPQQLRQKLQESS